MTSLAQPFVYKGLSLFMCVRQSRRTDLSHLRGLAVGLFYPSDYRRERAAEKALESEREKERQENALQHIQTLSEQTIKSWMKRYPPKI